MTKNKQKGFALVLSLVLLLAMSLMGGALIVIASSDHQGNNSSDEYQQTFYVAETALMQAEKSLVNKMMGPINNTSGIRNYEGSHDWMESLGVPGVLLIPAIVLEVVAPILVIVGYQVKISAALFKSPADSFIAILQSLNPAPVICLSFLTFSISLMII